MVATDLLPCATAKGCILKCNEFSSEGMCYIALCCKFHIHDVYYQICLHFQASSLQIAATSYSFIAHLAWLWCRTVTFYKVKSVVNTRTGYNMKSRTSSVIALRKWTCASGCFWHWSVCETRKLKCLHISRRSFDLESPRYSTCIMDPPECLRLFLFAIRLQCIYFWSWWLSAKGSMLKEIAVVMNTIRTENPGVGFDSRQC
jgi:hypothetical protein